MMWSLLSVMGFCSPSRNSAVGMWSEWCGRGHIVLPACVPFDHTIWLGKKNIAERRYQYPCFSKKRRRRGQTHDKICLGFKKIKLSSLISCSQHRVIIQLRILQRIFPLCHLEWFLPVCTLLNFSTQREASAIYLWSPPSHGVQLISLTHLHVPTPLSLNRVALGPFCLNLHRFTPLLVHCFTSRAFSLSDLQWIGHTHYTGWWY